MSEFKTAASAEVRPKGKASTIDIEAYERIVLQAELLDISLISSRFQVSPGYFSLDNKNRKDLKFSISSKASDRHFDPERGIAGAMFTWTIEVLSDGEEKLSMDCKFLTLYKDLKDQPKREVFFFIEKIGRLATYPYARAFVAQHSWMSGANLPILPVFREPSVRKSGRQTAVGPRTSP